MTVLSRPEALSMIYRSAAGAMKPLVFPGRTGVPGHVTEESAGTGLTATEIAVLACEFDTAVAAIGLIGDRLRALQARGSSVGEARSGAEFDDLVRPNTIVHKFGVSRQHLHRLCKQQPINGRDGFAFWSGNRFLISLSRFERYLRQHPLRRNETKKPGPETF